MKRLLILFLLLLSVNAFAFEDSSPMRIVASGSVTQANMRLSGVDGTAFVDFGAANVLTTKIGHLIKITDSAGKSIMGYIKAAGSSEGLDSDLLSGFDFTSGWSTVLAGSSIVDSDTFTTTGIGGVAKNVLSALSLYKLSFERTTTATGCYLRIVNDALTIMQTLPNISTGSAYYTGITGYTTLYLRNAAVGSTDVTTLKAEKVLTPSATGVTIVSSKGGATYNWFNKNSAFNWNDASGYKYEIIQENKPVLLDTDACTNANATINLTDGSAAWSCTGIDDSAYQDGKHICHVSDSAGRVVFGFYKASGSGAIVNAKSGSTQNWLYKNTSIATDGNYTRKIFYIGD